MGSPGDWFYTVHTHYFSCWLKTDPVAPRFLGFQATQYGRTSRMSSLCVVLPKEKQIDTEETQSKCQRRKRCFKIWQCHFWERIEEREGKKKVGEPSKTSKEPELIVSMGLLPYDESRRSKGGVGESVGESVRCRRGQEIRRISRLWCNILYSAGKG